MSGRLIRNPILPGFHPDPSIIRSGCDYWMATSTFEWFPGVSLFHSTDLVAWRPIGGALRSRSQLDLTGVPSSGGIWAPSLSFADGLYWLVYTVMRTRTGPYKDLANYLVTAESPEGPWSEPVFLNARGFDPSLYHDRDGRKWLVQILWDHRKDRPSFGGIWIQEYLASERRLVGQAAKIFEKTTLIEGPNLYWRDGWYYLMLAEGGTSWNHSVSMARSRALFGPYVADPGGPVVTSAGRPELELQKAGHGELVETPDGEWFLAHLASRPLATPHGPRCPLGRETCLQRVAWSRDGWLRLEDGGSAPRTTVKAPRRPPSAAIPDREAGPEWMTLREPPSEDWIRRDPVSGSILLRGRESPASVFQQSLVAQRVTGLRFAAETTVDFTPRSFQQMAGLIFFYDTQTHYYLNVTADDAGRRVACVSALLDGVFSEYPPLPLDLDGPVVLRGDWSDASLVLSAGAPGGACRAAAPALDASALSDDFGTGLHFTGAFVGLCAQDLEAHSAWAAFSGLRIKPLPAGEPQKNPIAAEARDS